MFHSNRVEEKIMKKLIALTLSALLLAGCTAGTPRKRPQPSSEIPSSSSTSEPEVISEVTAVSFNRDEINFNLKQRKRNNKEKDRVPPTTPLQDKENKIWINLSEFSSTLEMEKE